MKAIDEALAKAEEQVTKCTEAAKETKVLHIVCVSVFFVEFCRGFNELPKLVSLRLPIIKSELSHYYCPNLCGCMESSTVRNAKNGVHATMP